MQQEFLPNVDTASITYEQDSEGEGTQKTKCPAQKHQKTLVDELILDPGGIFIVVRSPKQTLAQRRKDQTDTCISIHSGSGQGIHGGAQTSPNEGQSRGT